MATAMKSTAKKPPVKKSTAKKPPVKKSTAKKPPVKKSTAETSPPVVVEPAVVRTKRQQKKTSVPAILLTALPLVVVIALIIGAIVAVLNDSHKSPTALSSIASHSATTKATSGLDPRFIQQDVGLGDLNRVIGKGLPGHTAKQFTASVLKFSGHSAQALAIYASAAHLWANPNSTSGLLTSDGTYLSQEGVMLWASLKGALTAKGVNSHVGNAPANWYNTGIDGNGQFGRSSSPGIDGDRRALIVTFKDGSKFVALRRCGNLAFPGKGKLPVGPTDNKLAAKIGARDPAARGNAPIGGGQNQGSGPGQYIPPSGMVSPPGNSRNNPSAPPANSPPTGSTPDPDPAPAPEPGASSSGDPSTGNVNPPGM